MCDLTKPVPQDHGINQSLAMYRERQEAAIRSNTYTVIAKPPYIFEAAPVILATGLSYDDATALKNQCEAEYKRRNPNRSWCSMHFGINPEGVFSVRASKHDPQAGDFMAWSYEEPTKHEMVTLERWSWGIVKAVANRKVAAYTTPAGDLDGRPSGAVVFVPASQFIDIEAARKAVEALNRGWYDQTPLLRCLAPYRRIVCHRESDSTFEKLLDMYGDAGIARAIAPMGAVA